MREDPSTVPCPLRAAARTTPEAPVIVGGWGTVSYAELDARASATEKRLMSLGLSEGDRVALHMPKDPGYLALLLALIRTGIVACPVSTRLPAGSVAPLLEKAGCAVLVSNDGGLSGAMPPTTKGVRPGEIVEGRTDKTDKSPHPHDIPLDQPATIIFTSGSTGTPKAALHTFGNHYFNALGSGKNIALAPGDRWLHSLPLYHVGGLSIIFRCLLAGATIVLPKPGVGLGESIREWGATHVSLVATQLRRLLREDADGGGLEAVLMGGGPIPPSLVKEAVARGLPVYTSYGLTEMASQVTATPPGATEKQLRTAGRVLPHREVCVSGGGEILVRGRTLFVGYVEGGETGRPFGEEGWFATGDVGELDNEGYLTVTGRLDNLFVSGGENVQPEEIEAALLRLEAVEEAAVVPVADSEFGARPVAFVRMSGETGDPACALEPVLPRFKIPKTFHDWEGTGGMKPDRIALKERARRLEADGRGSQDG